MTWTRCSRWVVLIAVLAAGCAVDTGRSGEAASEYVPPPDGGTNGEVCEPEHVIPVRLTSGAETDVATMILHTSGTHVRLWIDALPGYSLGNAYVTLVHDSVVHSFVANPEPWRTGYLPALEFSIPLGEVGLECGDHFKLVVWMRVLETSTWTRRDASAVGSYRYERTSEGWWDSYELCCPPDEEERGCTLTQGYWRNHEWPVDALRIGGVTYSREALLLYLRGGVRGNACKILLQQLFAARLNVESGASPIPAIELADAAFGAHCTPLGTFVAASSPVGQQLVGYAETLTDYNEGRVGPGHCEEDTMSRDPVRIRD